MGPLVMCSVIISCQGLKFSICLQSYNPKSLILVIDLHIIEGGVDFLIFTVFMMVYHVGANFPAKGQGKWYCVHK